MATGALGKRFWEQAPGKKEASNGMGYVRRTLPLLTQRADKVNKGRTRRWTGVQLLPERGEYSGARLLYDLCEDMGPRWSN